MSDQCQALPFLNKVHPLMFPAPYLTHHALLWHWLELLHSNLHPDYVGQKWVRKERMPFSGHVGWCVSIILALWEAETRQYLQVWPILICSMLTCVLWSCVIVVLALRNEWMSEWVKPFSLVNPGIGPQEQTAPSDVVFFSWTSWFAAVLECWEAIWTS